MKLTEMTFTELKSLKFLVEDVVKTENYPENKDKTLLDSALFLIRKIKEEINNRIIDFSK